MKPTLRLSAKGGRAWKRHVSITPALCAGGEIAKTADGILWKPTSESEKSRLKV